MCCQCWSTIHLIGDILPFNSDPSALAFINTADDIPGIRPNCIGMPGMSFSCEGYHESPVKQILSVQIIRDAL